MKAYDRSVPPRLARQRACKRHISSIGERAAWTVRPLRPLSEAQLNQICAAIQPASLKRSYLRRGLQEIAGSYLRQRAQPAPLKSEARYGLQLLAYKTWLLENGPVDAITLEADLRRALGGLNGSAISALWGGLARHSAYDGTNFYTYMRRDNLDWRVVGEAAVTGLSLLTGGDYTNEAAVIALQDLVTIYEHATGVGATSSRRGMGPVNGQGRQQEVGGSASFLFIAAFFEVIDAKVTPLWITGKLHTHLGLRRKAAYKSGLRPIFPTSLKSSQQIGELAPS